MYKMNQSAENGFLALPIAIAEFETNVSDVRLNNHNGIIWEHINNTNQRLFPKDFCELMDYYQNIGLLCARDNYNLRCMIQSVSREDWYLAFVIVDNLRHKLWSNEKR